MGWDGSCGGGGGSCRGHLEVGHVGVGVCHAGVGWGMSYRGGGGGVCHAGMGWVMQGWGGMGWVMQGWGGS